MKKEYDFSRAVQGKFYRPASQLRIPVYLDRDVAGRLRRRARKGASADISVVVNQILRKELEVLESRS
jgi:hypothetical protein